MLGIESLAFFNKRSSAELVAIRDQEKARNIKAKEASKIAKAYGKGMSNW